MKYCYQIGILHITFRVFLIRVECRRLLDLFFTFFLHFPVIFYYSVNQTKDLKKMMAVGNQKLKNENLFPR